MGLLDDYIKKKLTVPELENELQRLIAEYNKIRGSFLFVYASCISKRVPGIELVQEDYYIIHDILRDKGGVKNLDIYIETPGGSGQTVEEIVRFLRSKFESIAFVVSGEAKSAGTLLVLSGDDIFMTETGSLGPIDAQVQIGRSTISAYDYMEWVVEKRNEAARTKSLNPFDALMVAQISPGELGGVNNSLKFAQDLVGEWLVKYKFKDWDVTQTNKIPVTPEMKQKRAEEIAGQLINHSKWRLHGRSIKREDLDGIGLLIKRVEEDPKRADIVYRIQTVCRLIFDSSSTFKIFATKDSKIFKTAVPAQALQNIPQNQQIDVVQIEVDCPKCGIKHKIYGKFIPNPKDEKQILSQGFEPFPKDCRKKCKCGFEIDLSGIKNQVEMQSRKKILV